MAVSLEEDRIVAQYGLLTPCTAKYNNVKKPFATVVGAVNWKKCQSVTIDNVKILPYKGTKKEKNKNRIALWRENAT